MNQIEKAQIMAETSQHLIDMIQNRLTNRLNALNALQMSPMDSVPDEVKKMREVESSIIRAVMQEQSDLIQIIKILFPKVEPLKDKKPRKSKNTDAKN